MFRFSKPLEMASSSRSGGGGGSDGNGLSDNSNANTGAGMPKWTLRCRAADGRMCDHFETTRFKRKRTFDVLNLQPGTYDLFIGIRRDDFFFEQAWGRGGREAEQASIGSGNPVGENATKRSLDDDSGDDEHGPEAAEDQSVTSSGRSSESRVVKHIRAGIGAAFHGGRKVLTTVTMGKMGILAVDLDISLLDSQGIEQLYVSEQLVCDEKPNFELRFAVKDPESCIQIKVRSLSTIHSICVFASLFQVAENPHARAPEKKVTSVVESVGNNKVNLSNVVAAAGVAPGQLYEHPTQMLRRALTGSRHPERSAFARALAVACLSSWCGFTLGFVLDASYALPIALLTFLAWFTRAVIHAGVIAMQ